MTTHEPTPLFKGRGHKIIALFLVTLSPIVFHVARKGHIEPADLAGAFAAVSSAYYYLAAAHKADPSAYTPDWLLPELGLGRNKSDAEKSLGESGT